MASGPLRDGRARWTRTVIWLLSTRIACPPPPSRCTWAARKRLPRLARRPPQNANAKARLEQLRR